MANPLNSREDGEKTGNGNGSDSFLAVVLGAAKGGPKALEDFFRHTTPGDACYLIMAHLDANEIATLVRSLKNISSLPVAPAKGKIEFAPNHIYIFSHLDGWRMEEDYLLVTTESAKELNPIDRLMEQVGSFFGMNAIGIILSGEGSDGAMGIRSIKKSGGVIFTQNPREAEQSEMCRNAIVTECVDEILSASEIPSRIHAIKKGNTLVQATPATAPERQHQALEQIFNEIIHHTGHDFTNYKKPTLLRRIERRLAVHQLPDLTSYAAFIADHSEEVAALVNDLLISVTSFFRDAKAFEALEQEVLPMLLKAKKKEEPLRIWIPGCATGEEAYTIAILCAEKTADIKDLPKIQIFATDIDTAAISTAREGLYTANELSNVSSERVRRFFTREENMFRIRREIRETIMFANHNFLKDPPFSHLDLVSCRNVLIYLDRVAKDRVINTFHFALDPGGFLLLGSSESVDPASGLFSIYSREHHIFQSRRSGGRIYASAEPRAAVALSNITTLEAGKPELDAAKETLSMGSLHLQLLEQYAPPSLLVNEEYDLVHLSETAGQYLQMSGGNITRNILKLIRPELRPELRTALYQATQRKTAVSTSGLEVDLGDRKETINILVKPVVNMENSQPYFLIIFGIATGKEQEVARITDEPVTKHLEDELARLKTQLRFSNEQHEFQAEELKASNEELQAMNEELRSAAEELETNKEELQSINEELRTVNEELKLKIGETSLFANNLQNLINSTDIGTIFLDRGFRVALFTPAARNIFNLILSDYGRPITDITSRLTYSDLLKDAEAVLDKLTMVEKEVTTTDNQVYLMRLFPYRTTDDRINGIVVTFIDINTRKIAEEKLKETIEELTRFNKAMISRETRMIELKKEVNELKRRLGEPEIYRFSIENDTDDGQQT
ncbi:CheR family methyltransferase [Niabella sp. 22666]|uniref:CheR family methyltransferase n=1 Tax=Niabella sp. 22666 TaxID=3453954 RepID=UPI003F85CEDD